MTKTKSISPLRQRMIDDMRMRKMQPETRDAYVRSVKRLAEFLRRSPDTATAEDLRRFQLYLTDQGATSLTVNRTLTGLKFFFRTTVGIRDATRGAVQAVASPPVPSTRACGGRHGRPQGCRAAKKILDPRANQRG
jgi:site-specific recombinase XerD